MLGLNQRHPPCHDGALPTELIEHSLFWDGHFTHQAIYLEAVLLQTYSRRITFKSQTINKLINGFYFNSISNLICLVELSIKD